VGLLLAPSRSARTGRRRGPPASIRNSGPRNGSTPVKVPLLIPTPTVSHQRTPLGYRGFEALIPQGDGRVRGSPRYALPSETVRDRLHLVVGLRLRLRRGSGGSLCSPLWRYRALSCVEWPRCGVSDGVRLPDSCSRTVKSNRRRRPLSLYWHTLTSGSATFPRGIRGRPFLSARSFYLSRRLPLLGVFCRADATSDGAGRATDRYSLPLALDCHHRVGRPGVVAPPVAPDEGPARVLIRQRVARGTRQCEVVVGVVLLWVFLVAHAIAELCSFW